jgi:hypothetical protein
MAYGVVVLSNVQATDVQALNRSFVSASAIENSFIFYSTGSSTTTGESELYSLQWPETGSLLGLWMATSPEIPFVTDAAGNVYKGLTADPRNFYNAAGSPIDATKLVPGDIVLLSEDGFTGARSSNKYAVATADTWQLVWGATPVGTSTMCLKWIEDTFISIGSGAIDSQRVTAYRMEVLYN